MKRHIILISLPPGLSYSYENPGAIYPNIAILLLGTVLKNEGWDITIIDGAYDPDYNKNLINILEKHRGNIVFAGLSVMTTQVPDALKTAKTIRNTCPDIPIVFGGIHPTLFPEETVSSKLVDIVVINDGVNAARKLADKLANNHDFTDIPGLGYTDKDGTIHLNLPGKPDDILEFPPLDFSLIKIENYIECPKSVYNREFPKISDELRPIPILTALGCPYKCRFCINVILKRKYRCLPANDIIKVIKSLQAKYNARTFIFLDEDFFIQKERAFSFVELAEKENLHFNWRMWCRVDHFKEGFLDRKLLERMAKIGHGSLVMGGESADQDVLDSLQKGTTPAQIINSLSLLEGLPITPRYSFMVGLENETIKQIQKTYAFTLKLQDMRHDIDIAGPFPFRLYPGSPIYDSLTSKYDLKIPKALEQWECFLEKDENNFTARPWVPEEYLRQMKLILFYHHWALMRYSKRRNPLKNIVVKIIANISGFRIRHFNFLLPVEYLAIKYLYNSK